MIPPSPLLPLARMARELGVPRDWLQREAESGALPSVQAGDAFLFHPPVIERILVQRASQVVNAQT